MVDESSMDGATDAVRSRFRIAFCAYWRQSSIALRRKPADREAAFRLRFEAYQKIGFLQSTSDGDRLYDARYDDAPNA